jgi:thiol-disulfide isomerase/thioredoxin
MSRRGVVVAILMLALSGSVAGVFAAAEDPLVVFFYAEGCPDCVRIKGLLDALLPDLPRGEDDIAAYNVADEGTLDLLAKLESAFGVEILSTPVLFIGSGVFTADDEPQIMDAITRCAREGCPSPLAAIAPKPFPWGDLVRLTGFALFVVLLAVWQTR